MVSLRWLSSNLIDKGFPISLAVELGPITGMAEAIVDLVATGKTLKENGLIKIDDLFYSTARLIGNPLSMRLDDNYLRDTILSIESINAL